MIRDWLNSQNGEGKYVFKLINISETKPHDELITEFFKEKILLSYRSAELYKFMFRDETPNIEAISKYVKEYVIPSDSNQIGKNVKQGDWGEIFTSLIVSYFQDLEVPLNKLKWKFNKDRSVFSTDMLAHNSGNEIRDIYYYEIKTRLFPQKKEGKNPDRHYISVIAHNSLLKDEQAPTEAIADFLMREYVEKENFEKAKRYKDIVLNPQNYKRNFELFFIIEKCNFIEEIISDLNLLPPQLNPLNVTVIYIDNLKDLIDNSWANIEDSLAKIIHQA